MLRLSDWGSLVNSLMIKVLCFLSFIKISEDCVIKHIVAAGMVAGRFLESGCGLGVRLKHVRP